MRRHQLARRLRHLMRSRMDDLPDGVDVVIRALPAAAVASSVQLGAELDALLPRIRSDLAQQTASKPTRVSS